MKDSFSINKIYEVCKRTYEESCYVYGEARNYNIAYNITLELLKMMEHSYGFEKLPTNERSHYGGDWVMYEWDYLFEKIKRSRKLKEFDFFILVVDELEKIRQYFCSQYIMHSKYESKTK